MIIGISGAACSGKSEAANYLLLNGFTMLQVRHTVPPLRIPSVPEGVPGYDFVDDYEEDFNFMGGNENLISRTISDKIAGTKGDSSKDEVKAQSEMEQSTNPDPSPSFQRSSSRKKTIKELMNELSDEEDAAIAEEEGRDPRTPSEAQIQGLASAVYSRGSPSPATDDREQKSKDGVEQKAETVQGIFKSSLKPDLDATKAQPSVAISPGSKTLASQKDPHSKKITSNSVSATQKPSTSPSKSITDLIHQMTVDATYGNGNRHSYGSPKRWDVLPNNVPYSNAYSTPSSANGYLATPQSFGPQVTFSGVSPIAVSAPGISQYAQQNLGQQPPFSEFLFQDGRRRLVFEKLSDLTAFVGSHWRSDFVIILTSSDSNTYSILSELSKMPYFLHIAMDAPIITRWKRYLQKYHDYDSNPVKRMDTNMMTATLDAMLGEEEPSKRESISDPDTKGEKSTLSGTPYYKNKPKHGNFVSEAELRASLNPPVSLEEFVEMGDSQQYGPNSLAAARTPDSTPISSARITIVNNDLGLGSLYVKLGKLNLRDPERLRPSWDLYFMRLAGLAALRSNCMRRRVGCVIVRENRVISTGYNGTPRGLVNCNEGGCARCNGGGVPGANLDSCVCLHAEENALLEAGRDRVGNPAIIYCSTAPCLTCSIKIVQCGIKEVIYEQKYSKEHNSEKLFAEAGIKVRQYIPPNEGIVM